MHRIKVYDKQGSMFEVLPAKARELTTAGWTLTKVTPQTKAKPKKVEDSLPEKASEKVASEKDEK